MNISLFYACILAQNIEAFPPHDLMQLSFDSNGPRLLKKTEQTHDKFIHFHLKISNDIYLFTQKIFLN